MLIEEATVGTRVRSLVDFAGVPRGTEGVVDEDYATGVMVAWDLPDRPLPAGYARYDGRPAVATGRVRDGFDKGTELRYLEVVGAGVLPLTSEEWEVVHRWDGPSLSLCPLYDAYLRDAPAGEPLVVTQRRYFREVARRQLEVEAEVARRQLDLGGSGRG